MSRVGKQSIDVPLAVDVEVSNCACVTSSGSIRLVASLPDGIRVEYSRGDRRLFVKDEAGTAKSRALHGLVRALISNNIKGLSVPWEKRLEIVGVGYQAVYTSGVLSLTVGFADVVRVAIPKEVVCTVPDPTHLVVSGPDKHLVGQVAANIRAVRPPEPYKGKGIKYNNEHVKRKSGKAFGS
jgi:large subunit ribosomal protein L6